MSGETGGKDFEALLDYVKGSRGFDFSGYKLASLMRRVGKRLETVGVSSFAEYQDYLEVHADEFSQLFNAILINVTAFFRDPPAWDYLRKEIIPRILADTAPAEAIRVWSAGCSSGEEAYSLAMAFAEPLGPDAFRARVKIYATDVDQEALAQARAASYGARALEGVPDDLRARYFQESGERFIFSTDLRRAVIFGRHDLLQDAPISRLDLLVCRNTLMYFNAEAQATTLARFHFALKDHGFVFLGKAEMLLTRGNLFVPTNLTYRIFRKASVATARDRILALNSSNHPTEPVIMRMPQLHALAFDASPEPTLVLDGQGLVGGANAQARTRFGISDADVGRPFRELEISYRPVELRSRIEEAIGEDRAVTIPEVEWRRSGEVRYFEVQVTPLQPPAGGVMLVFTDVTSHHHLEEELTRSRNELQTAHEELQSSNEELETTNEELQSTNEELETTVEELQSTNEELETMNEELQSTNEELEATNEELRERTDEAVHSSFFLRSILSSLYSAVVVVDRDLKVAIWNERAQDLWGLRADEVMGKSFTALDIGLPVAQLREPLRASLDRREPYEQEVRAVNRRGRAFRCRVMCTPLIEPDGQLRGAVLLLDDHGGP